MGHDSHFCWNCGSSPPKRIANIFHLLCSTFCKVQHDIILHLRFQHIHHFRTFQNTPTWNSLKNAPGPVAWYHISGRIWNLTCTDWNILGNCHWPRRWKPKKSSPSDMLMSNLSMKTHAKSSVTCQYVWLSLDLLDRQPWSSNSGRSLQDSCLNRWVNPTPRSSSRPAFALWLPQHPALPAATG